MKRALILLASLLTLILELILVVLPLGIISLIFMALGDIQVYLQRKTKIIY